MKRLLEILFLLNTVIFYKIEGQGVYVAVYLYNKVYCNIHSFAVLIFLRGTEYGNNSLVRAEDIGNNNEALTCSTDYRPCCGTPPNRYGEWYYPNDTKVRPVGSGDILYRNRLDNGTVRLNRRTEYNILPVNGRYKCVIPNNHQIMVNIFVYVLRQNCKYVYIRSLIPRPFEEEKGPGTLRLHMRQNSQ